MDNDAVRRLRERGAWVLLGSVGLQLMGGLIGLFFGGTLTFTYRAYSYVVDDQFFTGVAIVGVAVLAVLVATRLGGAPTPRARTITKSALILLGAVALFEAIAILAGLAAGRAVSGVDISMPVLDKLVMFLYGIAKLAVLAVGGYYVLSVFQSFGPARPAVPQYPQQMYDQQTQPPYGPGYGHPRQPYYQPQHQRSYAQPQAYGQAAFHQPHQPYGQPQQGYGSPAHYPPSGQAQQPPSAPFPPPASSPQQPASQAGEGEPTRVYGPGELSVPQDSPKERQQPWKVPGDDDRSRLSDPYRSPQ